MIEERILAIDFGSKRVGLALCDPLKIFAYPYLTLNNDNNFWDSLKKVILENKIVLILLGYPLKESGDKSESTILVEKFHKELSEKFNIPILLRDERYTSLIAENNILESVTSKKKRRDKGLVDRNAAAVILKEYLDEINR